MKCENKEKWDKGVKIKWEKKNKCVRLQKEGNVQHIYRKQLAMLIYYAALVPYMSETSDSYCVLNLLKPPGHVMHHQFNIQQLYVLPTLYLCVLYLSENKQRLVPLTA
jgi:hypothetical protein